MIAIVPSHHDAFGGHRDEIVRSWHGSLHEAIVNRWCHHCMSGCQTLNLCLRRVWSWCCQGSHCSTRFETMWLVPRRRLVVGHNHCLDEPGGMYDHSG